MNVPAAGRTSSPVQQRVDAAPRAQEASGPSVYVDALMVPHSSTVRALPAPQPKPPVALASLEPASAEKVGSSEAAGSVVAFQSKLLEIATQPMLQCAPAIEDGMPKKTPWGAPIFARDGAGNRIPLLDDEGKWVPVLHVDGRPKTLIHDLMATEFRALRPLLNQHVLNDAHRKGVVLQQIFAELNVPIRARPAKTMQRIRRKEMKASDDMPYKLVSDLCAVRVEVPPSQVLSVMNQLSHLAQRDGAQFFVRNSIVDGDNRQKDWVQYAFMLHPEVGYITEIQVGPAFTSLVFTYDSARRDLKDDIHELKASTDPNGSAAIAAKQAALASLPNLWAESFYENVRDAALGRLEVTETEWETFKPQEQLVAIYEAAGRSIDRIDTAARDIVESLDLDAQGRVRCVLKAS